MSLKNFLKSKLFFKHLALMALSFVGILILVNILLKIYTRHGHEYEVPEITGKNIEDVQNMSEMSMFELVVLDSIYREGVSEGTILNQDPSAGSMVKKGRKIYITVASRVGDIVQMCNCKDQGLKSAVQMLIDKGLKVGTLLFRTSDMVTSPRVVEQRYKGENISYGTDIQVGERIDLVVEVASTTDLILVPDILGRSENEAEILLWKAGLNVGNKDFNGDKDEKHSRVVSYSPASPRVTIGTSISLEFMNDESRKFQKNLDKFKEELDSYQVDEESSTTEENANSND